MLGNTALTFLLPALAAGLLVLASHVVLGREVLRRGIVFIDLAVAQIAGLGVVAAHGLGWHAAGWQTQTAAGLSAIAGAGLLVWLERRWPDILEALIGILFILAASLASLLSAGDPHGGEQIRDLLVGQILWTGWRDLPALGLLTVALLSIWWSQHGKRPWVFYPCLALAVTSSVQLVGIYLVFASLILPALAVRRLPSNRGTLVGWLTGAIGYAVGLGVSTTLDLPTGPVIVVSLGLLALLVAILVHASATRRM